MGAAVCDCCVITMRVVALLVTLSKFSSDGNESINRIINGLELPVKQTLLCLGFIYEIHSITRRLSPLSRHLEINF